jgi:hypothetical protein
MIGVTANLWVQQLIRLAILKASEDNFQDIELTMDKCPNPAGDCNCMHEVSGSKHETQ